MEHGQTLWLAPLIPSEWLRPGKTLTVSNAPTRFGPVSFRIAPRIEDGAIAVTVTPPNRVVPDALVVRLRHPEGRVLDRVEVNGRPYSKFDPRQETITLPSGKEDLSITARYR